MNRSNGFSGFDRNARRAERLEKFPLTLGLVSYKTVRDVALAVAALLTLVTPSERIPSHVHKSKEGTTNKTQQAEPVSPVLATTPTLSSRQQ